MIWAHCTYAAPVLVLLVILEIKVWVLGVLIATRGSWLLGLWWTRVKQYLHVQTDALTHTYTHTCIHVTWECFRVHIVQKWAHTKISNSNSSSQFLSFHMSLLPQWETWLPKTVTHLLNANMHLEFFQNCFVNITTKNTLKLFRIFFFLLHLSPIPCLRLRAFCSKILCSSFLGLFLFFPPLHYGCGTHLKYSWACSFHLAFSFRVFPSFTFY